MCTVSWTYRPDGYELFFNRDEQRSRGIALPPEIRESAGVKYLAPIDPDAGGTWLAVNEYGLSLGLLNNYRAGAGSASSAAWVSRGLLLLSLIDCADSPGVLRRLKEKKLERFRPFILVAFDPDSPPLSVTWNGREKGLAVRRDPDLPLSSSSVASQAVSEHRRALLRDEADPEEGIGPARLLAYHRSHDPAPGPYSVCMHRKDARTVSLSRVSVRRTTVAFRYAPGPACRTNFLAARSLPRKSRNGRISA